LHYKYQNCTIYKDAIQISLIEFYTIYRANRERYKTPEYLLLSVGETFGAKEYL